MILQSFCSPTILNIVFSLTHIIIDIFKGLYNTAFIKFIMMIGYSFLLNLLCKRGLTVISWFIVFVPFITMTIISTLSLYILYETKTSKDTPNYKVDYYT
jgi:hypothetical protein